MDGRHVIEISAKLRKVAMIISRLLGNDMRVVSSWFYSLSPKIKAMPRQKLIGNKGSQYIEVINNRNFAG